jgi:uncharacterized protein (TIGR02001 family)
MASTTLRTSTICCPTWPRCIRGTTDAIPGRHAAPAARLLAPVAALLLWGTPAAHAGDWSGTVAMSSQLVDRGVAVTPPAPIAQGAVNWVARDGWSLGVSASYQTRDPGRLAETLAQVAKSWSLSDDWQLQAGLLDYRYPGGGGSQRTYDRTELGGSLIWRDVLTASVSAIKLAHRSGGLRGAADVGFRWPLGWHVSATGGIGLAQYLAPLSQYYPDRPNRYSYGHGGLVWQEGAWRVELIHVFTNRERNRGEQRVSPWTATVALAF